MSSRIHSENRRASLAHRLALAPYSVWAVIFVAVPLVFVAYYAFTDESFRFTTENLTKFFTAVSTITDDSGATREVHTYLLIFWRSVKLAVISTAICLLMGYPIAYIIARAAPRTQKTIITLIMIPMWMNFLLRTMAWQTLLEKNGVINTFLTMLHLPNIAIINTPAAIILGMVYNFLPFMVLPIYNTLAKIDDNVINAARDLGADNYQTLTKILLPLSVPGIVSGITMVFVPALTTFVISNLLGGSKILLIGNVIEQEFTKGSNWNLGAGLSIVLMVFILLSMTMIAKYDKDGEGSAF